MSYSKLITKHIKEKKYVSFVYYIHRCTEEETQKSINTNDKMLRFATQGYENSNNNAMSLDRHETGNNSELLIRGMRGKE